MATKMNCIAQHKNNKRKNDEEDIQTIVNRKKVSLNTQIVRGYDIWRQNQLLMLKDAELEKKKICFKQLGHNWSKLSVAEKSIWNEKALLQRNNLVPLSNEEKQFKSKKLLNQLTKVVEELANLGNEVVAVTCLAQGGPPIVTASEKGCQFLLKSEELDFQFKFSEFVKAPVLNMKKNKVSNATKNNLCIEVTNILNKKYEIARLALPIELQSKFSKGHIPYKKYVPSVIKAIGLPDGHVLKYPSSMGSTLLTSIVKNQDNIDVIFDLQEAGAISNTQLSCSVLPNTVLSSTEIDELLPVIKSVSESNTTASTTPNNQSTFELASFSNGAGLFFYKLF
ncbi:uncharacterized protein LOC136085980 [Hydra vulgaris]|uniref:Uncharacterized protein LOC136085980 n=1 Tax=Hydra vulgaris TaxID=6087 RepID=A0ABM4CQK4_HYDVU